MYKSANKYDYYPYRWHDYGKVQILTMQGVASSGRVTYNKPIYLKFVWCYSSVWPGINQQYTCW